MLLCDCPVIVDFTEAESRAKYAPGAYWDTTPSASFARSEPFVPGNNLVIWHIETSSKVRECS